MMTDMGIHSKKVGILTWHYYPNFGSALQAFALQTTLSSMCGVVSIINYRNPKIGVPSIRKDNIRLFLGCLYRHFPFIIKRRYAYPSLYFRKKYLRETDVVTTKEQIEELSSHFDTIVFGSDQIWAPNVYNPVYMGDYIASHVKKVSYAASIGLNYIPKDKVGHYKKSLSTFSMLSIREEKGKELLSEKCELDAKVVLDPTMLVDVSVYKKMARRVRHISTPFVFCYFLNDNHEYKRQAEKIANDKNLQIIGVSANVNDRCWMQLFDDLGADEFLWMIQEAQIVLTDSYHGTIFSLLFHKDFRTFVRFKSDDPINQNSRILQLDSYFGISSRIVSPDKDLSDADFDYEAFENRLSELRETSLDYLRTSI